MKDTDLQDGFLLNGRIHYAQHAHGYRTGIEPILLAAAITPRSGQSVLDAGCGAGASLLCLHHRNPILHTIGLEADAATALLARHNLRANGITRQNSHVLHARIPQLPTRLRQMAPNPNGRFHHVITNPPWYAPTGRTPTHARRSLALRAEHISLEEWLSCLTHWVLPGGTLTTIVHSNLTDRACMTLREHGCGSLKLMPLWPRAGHEAKLILLQGVFGGKGSFRLLPGLVLHDTQHKFTPEVEHILRDGAALTF